MKSSCLNVFEIGCKKRMDLEYYGVEAVKCVHLVLEPTSETQK